MANTACFLQRSFQFPVPLIFKSNRMRMFQKKHRGTTEEKIGINRVGGKKHDMDLIRHDPTSCLLNN
jgi:hypothetical protein